MRLIFWIGLLVSFVLLLLTIEFSRKDKLSRDGFFIWLSLSIGLAFFSLLPTALRRLTELLGLKFTFVSALTVGVFVLLFLNIYAYAKINVNRRKLTQLAQNMALQDKTWHSKLQDNDQGSDSS